MEKLLKSGKSLDGVDFKILNILRNNSRIPIKEIAKQVYLSSPATSARIAKLEEQGYIHGYTLIEDEKRLGYPIKAIINVEVNRKGRDIIVNLANQCGNIVECDFVAGDFCMVLRGFFEDTQLLDKFIGEIQENGGETETQIVFKTPIRKKGIYLTKK